MSFETSVPGIFAVGDVRLGSMKRVASAVGEGAGAVENVHRYLNEADQAAADKEPLAVAAAMRNPELHTRFAHSWDKGLFVKAKT